MLRSSILFSCFILFLSFQLSAAEGFLKNNGHIRNASALFVKDDGAFQFFLRQRGFSYQFTSVMQGDDHQMRSFIRNKGLLANDFAVHTHRVDIDLVGGNPNPSVIANKPVASKYRHSREEGKWLELYEGVTYKDVYNGIDLVLLMVMLSMILWFLRVQIPVKSSWRYRITTAYPLMNKAILLSVHHLVMLRKCHQ